MDAMKKRGSVLDGAFLASLETLDLYIHQIMSGRFGGSRRSHGAGSSCEFLDYAEYMPGDDLRRIDWNLAGRLEKFYIKRFVDERQQETRVYLDLSRSMDADGTGHKALTALQLAAAMGYLSVQNMDRVSYRTLSGTTCQDLCGCIIGCEAFFSAMESLDKLTFNGEDRLDIAIKNDPSPGGNDGISIVISDFLTDSDWKSAVDYLLSRKREVALIQVLTQEEISPAFVGPLSLIDSESVGEEDRRNISLSVDRASLKAYKKAIRAFFEDMRAFCDSRGVTLMTVTTDMSVTDAIIKNGFSAKLVR